MITLNLEDYCHEGCMRFEPKVLRGVTPSDMTIIVTCENWAECQYMVRYLKKHGLEKENSDGSNGKGSGNTPLGSNTESGE